LSKSFQSKNFYSILLERLILSKYFVNLVDTHCHLDFNHYDKDRDAVMERAWHADLNRILVPGIDVTTSRSAVMLADEYPKVFASVGIHPNSALSWDDCSCETLELLAKNPRVVAIGEVGLDYYRDRAPRELQREIFLHQLSLAERLNLPVVIHTRNASLEDRSCIQDVTRILSSRSTGLEHPGVIHSYSGNWVEAEELLGLGFFLGITGPVTYKKARELRKVVEMAPLERLLIETDGPFLPPQPKRGRRNEPAYVKFVAEKIAEVRKISIASVVDATTENAMRLFRWVN
jgi:TatD DNase family protein